MTVTKHLLIHGRVQGVGFRMSMYYAARRYNVTGWVRNRQDGLVEAMVQGREADVAQVVEWAGRGPDLAQVDRVDVSDGTGDFADFVVRDSA